MRSNFSDILSQSEILDSPAELEHYGRDWCKEYSAAPSLILLPKSQSQVSTILQRCNERRIPIVPSGGRTGLSGGATATQDEVIVSTERLNKIIEINPLDFTARCEAGVVTQQLQTAASDHGLCYPISFASAGSSQIGGNIATNAGGVKVIRYGSTRDWVLGLRVCLASGEVLELNGSLYKNQTGYNLLSLFVGSEGTLGIITEATLKLCAPPRNLMRFMAGTKSIAKSLQILKKLRTSSYQVSMFEYMASNGMLQVLQHTALTDPFPNHYPAYLLVELEDIDREAQDQLELFLSGCIECGELENVVVSQSSQQFEQLLQYRELLPEVLVTHNTVHKNDLAVPIPALDDFTCELDLLLAKSYPDFECVIFGHLGDGNLHVNTLKPNKVATDEFYKICHEVDDQIFALVHKYDGSISAEHGIGLLKRDFLHHSRSTSEIELMRQIKQVLDPNNILNPGKIL